MRSAEQTSFPFLSLMCLSFSVCLLLHNSFLVAILHNVVSIHSVEKASEMADAALQVLVVRTVPIEKTLIAGAVHKSILRSRFVLHIRVLGGASPVDQILSGLKSWTHGNTREEIVILGLKRALHS